MPNSLCFMDMLELNSFVPLFSRTHIVSFTVHVDFFICLEMGIPYSKILAPPLSPTVLLVVCSTKGFHVIRRQEPDTMFLSKKKVRYVEKRSGQGSNISLYWQRSLTDLKCPVVVTRGMHTARRCLHGHFF